MNAPHTFPIAADKPETAFARFMREQAEADNAKRAELAAFIAAHDDVLDGNMEHRGAAGWRYCLTVRIDDCYNTHGIGWTLADAYASAREGAAKDDAAMRDLIAPIVRVYWRETV